MGQSPSTLQISRYWAATGIFLLVCLLLAALSPCLGCALTRASIQEAHQHHSLPSIPLCVWFHASFTGRWEPATNPLAGRCGSMQEQAVGEGGCSKRSRSQQWSWSSYFPPWCAAPAQHTDPQPLTVLLGQLYFSKTSCTRSSPPSVNIMIILLQLARVMLDCGADTAPVATLGASNAGHRAGCSQGGWPQPISFPSPFLLGQGWPGRRDTASWGMILWLMPLGT